MMKKKKKTRNRLLLCGCEHTLLLASIFERACVYMFVYVCVLGFDNTIYHVLINLLVGKMMNG